ncbi:Eco29kI family restriction endonuclease [Roseiflexus sp.]|uniref:Eco29kI family restriction endonuclease n=1 Tax=Roseiflexus sp. TaxID=2562120 RepID=UPI00398A8285
MKPFNPLDKKNLGISVAKELLSQKLEQLPPTEHFAGAGVYAIYYTGVHHPYPLYEPLAIKDLDDRNAEPIYVGKAVPSGSRAGGSGLDTPPGNVLFGRLREHAASIQQAQNLDINDFLCRCLVVDDIWIALAESLLIEMFAPVWNTTLSGFGSHDPGKGRYNQQRSPWDTLHPGRIWAARLQPNMRSEAQIDYSVRQAIISRRRNNR